jgi:predicted ATPase/class 3 adenylate cyclase
MAPEVFGVDDRSEVATILFTDVEGSSRLWERSPDAMGTALARHDAIARSVVDDNRGVIVKMIGDGMHAVFMDPLDAVSAAVQFQCALDELSRSAGVGVHARCGVHLGVVERRDNDYFGNPVNRAARIMNAAHGGQVLLSQAVVDLVRERLPDDVTLRDLGMVRLRDLESPEHVHQLIHPRLRADFPALRSLETKPNNLPLQLTSFIGREHALAEVKRILAATRLLTLHGPGGIGKTRLSLQLAADVIEDYPDGVWFVELAGLSDGQLVPQAVASVLGVKEHAGRPVLEALVTHLQDRVLLLVLDNCEHLLDACAELIKELLQAGPRLRIVASSRQRLNVTGEAMYEVPSLAVPDPGRPMPIAVLEQYEAVRLFSERAGAAQPAFRVSDQNAAAVASICHRLDGIPLALELAAARVRTLSVQQIAVRLDDRFRLLTVGDRTTLPRQQTLRALIDWSYDLLSGQERTLLGRLAVFSGGWTLDAAEAVLAYGEIAESEVLDVLGNLVEKSLVDLEPERERYRLLETVKQYAQERLDAAGEADRFRTRHLAYFLALAEKARPELVGSDQAAWLRRLDLERENILSAHAWGDCAKEGAELGLRLASSMRRYWIIRGLPGLGHRVTREALSRPGAQDRTYSRCQGLFDAGQLCSFMGRYEEARGNLEESLAIAREIGDKRSIALALQPLGIAYHGQGDLVTARRHFEEALVLARELGNKREVAAALNALAQLHRVDGQPNTAEPLYEQALALARELEDREIIAIGLLNLAMVSIGRGSGERVTRMLLEVLAIAEEIGSKPAVQSVLDVSAGLAAFREEWACAARFYGAAEAQTRQTGLHRDRTDEAFLTPLVAKAREALGAAAFAAAEDSGHSLTFDEAIVEVRAWLEKQD